MNTEIKNKISQAEIQMIWAAMQHAKGLDEISSISEALKTKIISYPFRFVTDKGYTIGITKNAAKLIDAVGERPKFFYRAWYNQYKDKNEKKGMVASAKIHWEHAVPMCEVAKKIFEYARKKDFSKETCADACARIASLLSVVICTCEENDLLKESKLDTKMPDGWGKQDKQDNWDVWARYKTAKVAGVAGIEYEEFDDIARLSAWEETSKTKRGPRVNPRKKATGKA